MTAPQAREEQEELAAALPSGGVLVGRNLVPDALGHVEIARPYAVLERLHMAGIIACVESCYAGDFRVQLGIVRDSGFHAWDWLDLPRPCTYPEAMRLLAQAAVERYPESQFAVWAKEWL